MNDLEFVFEQPTWMEELVRLQPGSKLSAVRLLTMLEQEDDDSVQDALEQLNLRHITLDISALPKTVFDSKTQTRLQQEMQLVKKGLDWTELDSNDPLRLYLEELSRIPVAGDPKVLAQKLSAGEESAARKLADLMLGKVVELAQEHVGNGVLLLDLIQEGGLGLWQAIQSYTEGDLEAQCLWMIRQSMAGIILLQARQSGVGQKLRQAMEDYRSVDEKLLAELGRNPTLEEIAEGLHMTAQQTQIVAEMVDSARMLQRVKTPEPEQIPQEEDQAVEDTAYFQMRQRIADLLSGLSQQDAQLLSMRYGLEGGLPMDARQVAAKLGMTKEDVIQREAAALAKLRQEHE